MRCLLRASRIKGWRRHLDLPGSPDFSWRRERAALFVDGCFWHGCPRCYQTPKSNVEYWIAKIHRNKERDSEVGDALRGKGWKVVRVFECELKEDPEECLRKVSAALEARRPRRQEKEAQECSS